MCGADTPRSRGAPLHPLAPPAGRAPLQKLPRDPRAGVASGIGPRRPPGVEPPLSRFVPRCPSSAKRGRRRGRLRLKLAERRRGTGRPFPPPRNAPTHLPSLPRRLGERPPAESPGVAEPSLSAPRRRREAAGAWRAAAEPGPSPRWAGGEEPGGPRLSVGGRGGRDRRAARPRGGLWQPAPGRGRPRAGHGLAATGDRFQPGKRQPLSLRAEPGRPALRSPTLRRGARLRHCQ